MNVSVQVEAYLVRELLARLNELDRRHGPRRRCGPVTIEFQEDNVRVLIQTRDHGAVVYVVNPVGELVPETPSHA